MVSTDQAGNTTVDDNNGNLFTFQTLKAPAPPWFDNLESGAPGWTVVPDPSFGSDINWTLGTPNNGLVKTAIPGPTPGAATLMATRTFSSPAVICIAPVIDLSGLTSATLTFAILRFQPVADFSEIYEEDGVVYVSTNSSTPPGNLPMAVDFTGDRGRPWDQETVDLTPWVGKTIQVVFYYEGIEFGHTVYGWTLDDISITGVAAGGKSTSQKIWAREPGRCPRFHPSALSPSNPTSRLPSPSAIWPPANTSCNSATCNTIISPPDQTNTLAAGGTLNFTGNYSFLDANHNGISDAWEMDYFGSVATNRTQRRTATTTA